MKWSDPRSFHDLMQVGMSHDSSFPAVTCGQERFTYPELMSRCQSLASAIVTDFGLKRGDRVAVLSANCHRYLELYLAAPAAGLVLVPINVRLATPEVRYLLEDSGTQVLFTDRDVEGIDDLDIATVMMPDAYESMVGSATPAEWPEFGEEELAGIFYTGGTTGRAKGVMLTHGNLFANARNFAECWPFDQSTRWLLSAPMFHTAGTIGVIATILGGGRHVVLPSFEAGAFLDLVQEEGVTATVAVPATLNSLSIEQEQNPRAAETLQFVCHGSSPASINVLRHFHETFPQARLLDVFGATESSPIVTLLPDEQLLLDSKQVASCGKAASGIELRISGAEGPGTVGEVVIRGENIAAGYWNKPEETAAAFRDGWYYTGDLGYLDEEGFLYLVDRSKDMIVSGSENVYSAEVEAALATHPSVVEAAVMGVPHERWGEAVHAIVCVNDDVSADALLEHCRRQIAGYKVPKTLELRAEPLPRSAVGKILKRELREPYWSGRDRRIS